MQNDLPTPEAPIVPPVGAWRTVPTRSGGRRLLVCDEVTSTNDVAAGLAPGEAVVASTQSAGRGQHGRVWASPPGAGLWLSVRFDPPLSMRRPVVLTAIVAVAVGDAVRHLCGLTPALKWPNDLLLGGRKVCGILIEQRAGVVAGVGLNLAQSHADLHAAGLPDATSLAEFGVAVTPDDAANVVLRSLDDWLVDAARSPETLEAAWRDRLGLLGQSIVADCHDGTTVAGRLEAVGFDAVVVATPAGPVPLVPERVRHLRAA